MVGGGGKMKNLIILQFIIIVVALLSTGCANIDNMEKAKADAEYRKHLREPNDNDISTNASHGGPIEMPQEWLDQWPDE